MKNQISLGHLMMSLVGMLLMCTAGSALATADSLKPNRPADDYILWSANVAPPFHIIDGELAHQGVCDVLVDSFKRVMPNTQHQVEYLPQARIGMLWENEQNLCYPCMIHRPANDQQLIIYSEPTHDYPSHGIITRPALADTLTKKYGNPVDLELMLADRSYRFVQPIGRMYGQLQSLLEQYVLDTSLHLDLTSDNANTAMLSMILRERIDFTIDYPMIKAYYEQTEGGNLAFLPIAQLAGERIKGAVACTRNDWGSEVIQRINSAIPQVQQDPAFQQTLKQWLEPIQP
ncbi:hypothetical protein [Pseudidiomarina woesei]|uniref:Uncharacterized protein n=1 Tax=Pseudidiomarina woesei TaxID=1381080 RepID=A0A0K6H1R7_9GAMM|nr:hypothetical protein [Pseudidiomarina woesei]CUA84684.1 hypothetical protein Ga0061064_0975 [Pseudidiomarina woesei]